MTHATAGSMLCAFLFTIATGCSQRAEMCRIGKPHPFLSMTLSAPVTEYRQGEEARFFIRFANSSDQPVSMPPFATISDKCVPGTQRHYAVYAGVSAVKYPPSATINWDVGGDAVLYRGFTIPPNGAVEYPLFLEPVSCDVLPAGEYRIRAFYVGGTDDLSFELESNKVIITILPAEPVE